MVKRILYIITVVLLIMFVSLQTMAQQPSLYRVARISFSSEEFSEIAPVIVKDGIIFCSNKRFSTLKDRTAFDGRRLYNIYQAERRDTSDWTKPAEIKSERSSLFNNGPLCFAPDGKTVYFTSEVETGKAAKKRRFKNHLGIFIADLSGTDLISLRPFKFNNLQYDIAQPSVSSDGKFLFFASDKPGGQGGSDLYYCELINGEWSEPVNMGPEVNSSGVENYPFMHPSGKLYFTSDRPGGVGRLDVYFTTLYNGKWEDPVLLPEPINSTSDDFAFAAQSNLQTGYFSSNRRRSDDIYEFVSTIIRKSSCDTLVENSYCFRFLEENAVKFDTMPFRYEWKFGDGNMAAGAVVEHCYKDPGQYFVQLDVVNLLTKEVMYNEKTDTLVITEIEQPYISGPDKTSIGQKIELSADSTNLPGWKISSYYWNFGDETIAIGKEVDKTYTKPGPYNIQLIVSTEPEPGGMVREACISKNIIVIRQP
jgi:hypothetical protein